MKRLWPIFLLLSAILTLICYRDALWGRSLLAPLDIGPAWFTHFRHADPGAGTAPDNHHISDQFTYDLPLQAAVHRAYREGEIPWWDPWTYGGRPLLADAHVNGTDPVRLLCDLTLPFELAYNWNIALRGVLTGLGMFLLLRSMRVGALASISLALIHQFAGWFTLFFGHPWVQGSFLYYPYLWLLWNSAAGRRCGWRDAVAAVLIAGVFLAGNLQSHTYLPIFAVVFLAGFLLRQREHLLPAFRVVALSGIVGAILASPLLANQIEFFLQSNRGISTDTSGLLRLGSIPLSLGSIHPWACGSFRTIDLGRLFGTSGIAFLLFCGGAVTVMAACGGIDAWRKRDGDAATRITALLAVLVYLVVIGTPLSRIFYPRLAGLAGMGIVVMAGLFLRDGSLAVKSCLPWRWALRLAAVYLTAIVVCSGVVWTVYPKIRHMLVAKLATDGVKGSGGLGSEEQRMIQIARLPAEVTLRNPEAVVGLLSTLSMLLALGTTGGDSRRRILVPTALVLGLAATWSFHHRFRPKHDVTLWHKLAAGGPSQRNAIEQTRGGLRLDESSLPIEEQIFPHAWAALYRVHVVQGYSALQPRCLLWHPADQTPVPADWKADRTHTGGGRIERSTGTSPARFRDAASGSAAAVEVVAESHNRLLLNPDPSLGGRDIIRTDTHFPGWRDASSRQAPAKEGYAFSRWAATIPPAGPVCWEYTPPSSTCWRMTLPLGLMLLACLTFAGTRRVSHSSTPLSR
jgi:hypothetical protein